jgi:hypothetical protein
MLSRCHARRIVSGAPVDSLLRALMDLGELADGDQVVWCRVEDAEKFGACIFEATQFKEGATKCHPRRQIRWMLREAGLADSDRFFTVAGPPVFLCKLRKSNRRRILLDPASKVLDSRVIRHA